MDYFRVLLIISFSCGVLPQDLNSVSLSDDALVHDLDHIKHDLEGVIDLEGKTLNKNDLDFYFFKLHDIDSSGYLDGNELYSVLLDSNSLIKLDQGNMESAYIESVDKILAESDYDNNGLITWVEFLKTSRDRRKSESDK